MSICHNAVQPSYNGLSDSVVGSKPLTFNVYDKGSYTPERRKAMSEHMKQVRRERYWNSKGKSKQSQQP